MTPGPSPPSSRVEPGRSRGGLARSRPGRRRSDRGPRALGLAALAGFPLLLACATSVAADRPISDPGAVAAEARDEAGDRPTARVRLQWDYADERGPLRGDGVLRYNPPDSMRLDLFGPGDNSMSIALAGDELSSLGRIEDLRLPPPPFLYASAGIFRPAGENPSRGFRTDRERVLIFERGELVRQYRLGPENRLLGIEEVRNGTVTRSLTVDWPESGYWPSGAEYRNLVEDRRVRWKMTEVVPVDARFPARIFDLPDRS